LAISKTKEIIVMVNEQNTSGKILNEIKSLKWTQEVLNFSFLSFNRYKIEKPLRTLFGKIWWSSWFALYFYPAIYRPIKLYIDLGWSQYERDIFMAPENTFTIAWYTFDGEFLDWRSPLEFGTATIYEAVFFVPFWLFILAIPYHFLNHKLGEYLKLNSITKV
tara:strand:- start:197 stop:685 length:489 start_codon:yes stop_codon:yes gene_type:complete